MHIVLDANILIRDPWLEGKWLDQLLKFAENSNAVVLIMQPVEMEVRGNFIRKLSEKIESIKLSLRKAEGFKIMKLPDFDSESIRRETLQMWEKRFNQICHHRCVRVIPLENRFLETVLERYTSRTPPCSPEAEDRAGIKDTIIWMMLLDEGRRDSSIESVALITDDKDFREGEVIRPQLVSEADSYFKIKLYRSLGSFLKDQAHKPSDITIEWLREHLDCSKVEGFLKQYFTDFSDYSYYIQYDVVDEQLAQLYQPFSIPKIISSVEYSLKPPPTEYEKGKFYISSEVKVRAEVECRLIRPSDEGELPEYRTLECMAHEKVNLVLRISNGVIEIEDAYI